MKIILSESQLQYLKEIELSYTPEKIDQFVNNALKLVKIYNSNLKKYFSILMSTTIQEFYDNPQQWKTIGEKLKNESDVLGKNNEKLYSIIDSYDFFERPANIKKLNDTYEKLEEIKDNLTYLSWAYSTTADEIGSLPRIMNTEDNNKSIIEI